MPTTNIPEPIDISNLGGRQQLGATPYLWRALEQAPKMQAWIERGTAHVFSNVRANQFYGGGGVVGVAVAALLEIRRETSAIEARFMRLAEQWKRETGMESLAVVKFLHPAYQEIIGMGQAALPFIFKELRAKPGHWTWALQHIVGRDKNPVRQGANLRQAIEDWLEWGSAQGYA